MGNAMNAPCSFNNWFVYLNLIKLGYINKNVDIKFSAHNTFKE
jgi:hypothetical protein